MKLTRRTTLKWMGVAGSSAALGALGNHQLKHIDRILSDDSVLKDSDQADARTALLSDGTVQALIATAEAVVGYPIEPTHYQQFFRWRAENISGYAALYSKFVTALETARIALGTAPFVQCDLATRQAVVTHTATAADSTSWIYRMRMALSRQARWSFLFRKFIVAEILSVFAATDAWVLLGYEAWPGMARGFDNYRSAPPGLRNGTKGLP